MPETLLKPNIGKYLRSRRKLLNRTLHQVSMGTNIDSPLLSKIERGERLPTDKQVSQFARYYQVPVHDLDVMKKANRILKDFGANKSTYAAIQLVSERLGKYKIKQKADM